MSNILKEFLDYGVIDMRCKIKRVYVWIIEMRKKISYIRNEVFV